MKTIFILTVMLSAVTRSQETPGLYAAFTSPSGKIVAKAGIAGLESSPSVRFRVRVVFESAEKKSLGEAWTGYAHRWAAAWSDADVFLVCGINEEKEAKPFEFSVFDFTKSAGAEYRAPSAAERAEILEQYRRKYPDDRKEPNKAPEPTPPLVTPRAGARVAPSGAVAHL